MAPSGLSFKRRCLWLSEVLALLYYQAGGFRFGEHHHQLFPVRFNNISLIFLFTSLTFALLLIFDLSLRNRKNVQSYRNTSGSSGEREMLSDHEPQASAFTAFSSSLMQTYTSTSATP